MCVGNIKIPKCSKFRQKQMWRMMSKKQFYCGVIHADSVTCSDNAWWIHLNVCDSNKSLKCKVDTGAQANIISLNTFTSAFGKNMIKPSQARLTTYSGDRISVIGQSTVKCKVYSKLYAVHFIIVDVKGCDTIIGLKSSIEINLIKRVNQMNVEDFNDVFNGIGCLKEKHHINVDESVQPVICAPRRVPHALRKQVRKQLDKMVDDGILCRVDEPTKWVNAMCVVTKNVAPYACVWIRVI